MSLVFSAEELALLRQSCYGAPGLAGWLAEMWTAGPGDYGFPPEPGTYTDEQVPLYERTWAQIWHQGTIYPATFVAVPVWCGVVHRFPRLFHGELFVLLSLVEESRRQGNTEPPDLEAQLAPVIQGNSVRALKGLNSILPAQLAMADQTTSEGHGFIRAMAFLATT